MGRLDPDTYVCPAHGVDLTPLVQEQLDDEPVPITYDPRRLFARRSATKPFEVVVSCPGEGCGGRHPQPFTGTYTP